jgi:chromosome segregation ATPase
LEKNGAAAGIMRELGLNQLKMPDLNSLPLAMPTPSSMTPRSEFLANSPPKSTAAPPRPLSNMLESPSGPSQAEVQKLRATLTQSQLTLRALTSELDTLKKAKSDLEGELESLSQALFEEANKMVSEERKKHSKVIEEVKRELAEVREELDEVRKEREAVKRTMVLLEGGSARASMDVTAESAKTDTKTNANSDDGEKKGELKPCPRIELNADEDGSTCSDALPIVAPQPRVASAEEVEQLMKRMEEDFGKL